MVQRRGNTRSAAKPPVKRGRPAAKPTAAKQTTRKAAAKPAAKSQRDVTEYATKPATDYHKAFARWGVTECEIDLSSMTVKAAFLKGIQIATAARPAFMESDFLAEWREKSGQAKRGPKPKDVAPPEDEEEEEEFDDEVDDDADFDEEESDDESEEDDEFGDDEDEEDEEEEADDDFEEEPTPPKRTRKPATTSRARKGAPARSGAKATAAKSRARTVTDEEDLF